MPVLTLERLLASIGFGSRKEARSLVRMGLVELNGVVLENPLMEFKDRPDFITVNGEETPTIEKLYVMLYKPIGVECSHNARNYQSVYSLLPDRFTAMGIQTVGRLDADSEGLILLSNQGIFIHKIESPKKGFLKRYKVSLARSFTCEQKEQLLQGVMLKDERKPVMARSIEQEDNFIIITIGEGLYHQVRRMFAAVGNHVESLERISIGPLLVDKSLGKGGWRFLTDDEIALFS